MSTSTDICAAKSSGGDSGGSGGDEHKMCTSYEQKIEHCKKDGVSDVDDIADGIGKVDISDTDTGKVEGKLSKEEYQKQLMSALEDKIEEMRVKNSKQLAELGQQQDEISSIYSEKRNRTDNAFKAMELSDPEKVGDPTFELFKAISFEAIE